MANNKIKIYLTASWREEEADGQKCFGCKDTCFLFPPKRLVMTFASGRYDGDIAAAINMHLCHSCFDENEHTFT
tara:strand:+ start:404 stop:625 length:222 start_codon:yes stop_codon:yes gene_type:complete